MRAAALISLLTLPCGFAQTADPAALFRQDFLPQLERRQTEVILLAEAIPAEKYAWRPGPGVRSIGEAFVHIANGNELLLGIMRNPGQPKAELQAHIQANAEREGKVKDKAAVLALLRGSFDQVRGTATKADAAELRKPIPFFGNTVSGAGLFHIMLTHAAEHLGQEVAYARMNAIVPPWSR